MLRVPNAGVFVSDMFCSGMIVSHLIASYGCQWVVLVVQMVKTGSVSMQAIWV